MLFYEVAKTLAQYWVHPLAPKFYPVPGLGSGEKEASKPITGIAQNRSLHELYPNPTEHWPPVLCHQMNNLFYLLLCL